MNDSNKPQDSAVEVEEPKLTLSIDDMKMLDESDLEDIEGGIAMRIGWPPS